MKKPRPISQSEVLEHAMHFVSNYMHWRQLPLYAPAKPNTDRRLRKILGRTRYMPSLRLGGDSMDFNPEYFIARNRCDRFALTLERALTRYERQRRKK